jgi:L-ascorbate metabolism protein UlaG (beta-lactamase superfamily)
MTRRRALAWLVAAAVVGTAGCQGVLFNTRPSLDGAPKVIEPSAGAPVTVRFAGVSTLLFDDGETAFLTDGFFSRPRKLAMVTGIEPDAEKITQGLADLGLQDRDLAAVVVLHGHFDHALDAAVVADAKNALLVGDQSALFAGRPAKSSRRVEAGDQLCLGKKWRLTFVPSRHGPVPLGWLADGDTRRRVDAPARASKWRTGDTWSLWIEHADGGSYLVHASAGFIDGELDRKVRSADVVFLGIGSLGLQDEAYRTRLWNETVRAVDAKRVVLVHWDDFTRPARDGLVAMPHRLDDARKTFAEYTDGRDGVQVRMPPLYAAFDPDDAAWRRPPVAGWSCVDTNGSDAAGRATAR